MEKGFRTHEGLTAHFSRFFLGFKKGGARPVYKCICECVFFIIGQTNINGLKLKSGMIEWKSDDLTNEEFVNAVMEMIEANDMERPKDKSDAIEALRIALGV